MAPLIEVDHLRKYFDVAKGTLHAVDDVSFSIQEQTILGVVGESGCGKSTLGRTILRMETPTSGKILYRGEDITKYSRRRMKQMRTKMQMIFQDPYSSLDPRLSITQLIEEPLIIHRTCKSKAERTKRVEELMDTVGIARRYAHSFPHELDGGRRQRIGIARALALDPEFIVCDEPVSALDVSIQAQVINLLQDLRAQKKLTYMFITHDLSVVRYISDEICVMYLGQCVEKCGSNELFENTLHPYSQALLGAILEPALKKTRQVTLMKGELTSPIDPKPQCRFADRCPMATEECLASEPKLVEVRPNHFVACHHVTPEKNMSAKSEE